jgi:Holliday junction DNA helicase RuvA
MISQLTGQIVEVNERYLTLDVSGVGYQIFMSPGSLLGVTSSSSAHTIYTYMNVREQSIELFGFLDFDQKRFFELVIGISGIGPRGALGVIDVAPLPTLISAIQAGDPSYLTKVSGVGKKTAQKIVIELKDKIEKLGIKGDNKHMQGDSDAMEALIAIGYSMTQAREALKNVPEDVEDINEKIKQALKNLS